MRPSQPIERDLVLIGGGHAHLAVIKGFGMRPIPGVRLNVITRGLMTPYSGMVPGLIAGHYSVDEAHIDLQKLCRFAGARLFHAAATHVDLARREVLCAGRIPAQFDLLSIDTGSTPSTLGIDGARQYAIPIKPIDGFLRMVDGLEKKLLNSQHTLRIVVVGGGAGGVELCLSLHHRLTQFLLNQHLSVEKIQFTIASNNVDLLPHHAKSARAHIHRAVTQRGIKLHLLQPVTSIHAGHIGLADGTTIECDAGILATHAAAPEWLAASGLALDARGFIQVWDTLRSVSHENVFAAGDVAAMDAHWLAKSGVYAVRQGPVLLQNLRNALNAKPLRAYRPQSRTLSLISTGDTHAVASYGRFALQGPHIWRLKDRIDRRWMRNYQQLPEMPDTVFAEAIQSPEMRCGGCGAKVASDILQRVLAKLTASARPDIIAGLEALDDAAIIAPPAGKFLAQTVDHFRVFIDDPYLMGKITANHCMNDIFAMGAVPHSALAMVTLPIGDEQKMENDLSALLQGASEVLAAEDALLIGGHTSEGAELSFGLTINGVCDPASWWRKSGAKPGNALIVTKPLGTGALLAADMRAKANAQWVEAAIAMMLQSNGAAARCLREHGVTACTDISGFGLIGHLGEMLRASQMSAELQLGAFAALDGASETMANGIVSSLYGANKRNGELPIIARPDATKHPNYRLLFDPQTSGGLLAAVPQHRSRDCVAALRALGYNSAAIIGTVKTREGTESAVGLRHADDF